MSLINHWTPRILRGLGRRFLPPKYRIVLEYQVAKNSRQGFQFSKLKEFGPNRGVAIDAGANIGLFSYALSRLYQSVEAFEINPSLVNDLKRSVRKNVNVHQMGLSDHIGESTMYLPTRQGSPLVGWGSLEYSVCQVAEDHISMNVQVVTLDSMNFADVGFIKIDVEGHELSVLKGAEATISRCRPDVFIEIQDSQLKNARDFFKAHNYHEIDLSSDMHDTDNYVNYLFKA